MTLWISVSAWWLLGTSSMIWLGRSDDLTWGRLLLCSILGVLGPGLWIMIAGVMLSQADFWSKPIFRKRH